MQLSRSKLVRLNKNKQTNKLYVCKDNDEEICLWSLNLLIILYFKHF